MTKAPTRRPKPGIGHNSGQRGSEYVTELRVGSVNNDDLWRHVERHAARRERTRLMKSGVIRPAYMMQPQLMVKGEDGQWKPEIKVYA